MAGLQALQKEKGDRLLSEEEKDLGSEYECELMIEALRKELDMVRVSQACMRRKIYIRPRIIIALTLQTRRSS